jgi:peptidoglycan/LPS O-acetylase OafA/YrhL
MMGLLAAASFAAGILFIVHYPEEVFYFPFTRLWELLAGSYLAWRERRHLQSALGTATDLPIWLREAFSALGLLMLLCCNLLMTSKLRFPGWWALLPDLATMMIISAGPGAWLNRRLLSQRGMVGIGLISYPLYLWHWPILSLLDISEIELTTRNRTIALVLAFFSGLADLSVC